MKAMSRLYVALIIGMSVVGATTSSRAQPINLPIQNYQTYDQFRNVGGILRKERGLVDTFTFAPSHNGEVDSIVYSSQIYGYAYVYQVHASSAQEIDAISFDIFGVRPTFVFQYTDIPGSRQLMNATLDGRRITFRFGRDEVLGDGVPLGQFSWYFGFFNRMPPVDTRAMVTGRAVPLGVVSAECKVLTASPEPSVGVMFGLGLLGLPLFRKLRRKFMK
jgi:hypothetical protein